MSKCGRSHEKYPLHVSEHQPKTIKLLAGRGHDCTEQCRFCLTNTALASTMTWLIGAVTPLCCHLPLNLARPKPGYFVVHGAQSKGIGSSFMKATVHTFEPSTPPNLKVGYVLTWSISLNLECRQCMGLKAHFSLTGGLQNSLISSSFVLLQEVMICSR